MHKIVGHTADLRMYVEGSGLQELFGDALLGMMNVIKPDTRGEGVQRNIEAEGSDSTVLLINFLNEALLVSHINKEIYTRVEFKKLSKNKLKATLYGTKSESFDEDIKAVTFHEADIIEKDGMLSTNIIFDI